MMTLLTPTLALIPTLVQQRAPRPPGTPSYDRRYGWGWGNRAAVVVNGRRLGEWGRIRDNRVQVPMRPIFEALGATVTWYPENRKVVGRKGRRIVSLVLGQNFAYTPEPVRLDYPPRMVRGRVYVPLRFVSESLGGSVRFERRTKTVRVDVPVGRG